ncbi:MAG: UDP-N-acetylglucosamine 4,6-dehydratase (inverting) [Nitrospiria bacterium]
MTLAGKTILVTGGTGSFGKRFVQTMLSKYSPKRLIVFSRDEFKQYEMQKRLRHEAIRFFIGDVRDKPRLRRAFAGVDYVVHAAALKQVPTAEYNPFECIKTNIIGAQNIIDVAIDLGIKKVVALSTDKACNPINLYGATKLCSDKLFTAGNTYAGQSATRFSVVRYGNVVGSRGSVIPLFLSLRKTGVFPVTDRRMTRFWITLDQGVHFVVSALEKMHGGEIFVPKIPSASILNIAQAIAPECRIETIGIRPGEKLHEVLISEEDGRLTLDCGKYYVIQPQFPWWTEEKRTNGGKPVSKKFVYSSGSNKQRLSRTAITKIIKGVLDVTDPITDTEHPLRAANY